MGPEGRPFESDLGDQLQMTTIIDLRKDHIQRAHNTDVVLVDLFECEINLEHNQEVVQCIEQAIKNNNSVTIVTTNAGKEHFAVFTDLDVVNFPVSFFYIARNRMGNVTCNKQLEKHFVCMNNQPKKHRAQLVNDIFANGIDCFGNVSWRSGIEIAGIENKPCSSFDTAQTLCFDQINEQLNQQTQYAIAQEYEHAAVDFVTESVYNARGTDNVFVTEKTVRPLLLGKLFLCLSMPGHHAWLEQQGFELYHEIFDYAFDTEVDQMQRYQGYFENVKRICKLDLVELEQLYIDLNDKIMHNRNLAYTITGNVPIINDTVNEYCTRFLE